VCNQRGRSMDWLLNVRVHVLLPSCYVYTCVRLATSWQCVHASPSKSLDDTARCRSCNYARARWISGAARVQAPALIFAVYSGTECERCPFFYRGIDHYIITNQANSLIAGSISFLCARARARLAVVVNDPQFFYCFLCYPHPIRANTGRGRTLHMDDSV
jgi:hypothetical protein